MSAPRSDVTALLARACGGDRQAQSELFRLVEPELRRHARACLRDERPSPGMQTTVLVDDAFLKLVGAGDLPCESRAQFFCWASRVMREVLVDEARRRAAAKRGGGERPASKE